MNRTEDYLDGLLNSVEGKKPETGGFTQAPDLETGRMPGMGGAKSMSPEDEFLDSFEKELFSGDDMDDFIRQFEQELAFDDADGIARAEAMVGAEEQAGKEETAGAQEPFDAGNLSDLGALSGAEKSSGVETMSGPGMAQDDIFFENLDGIVNSVKEELKGQDDRFGSADDMDIMVDTIGDLPGQDLGLSDAFDEPTMGLDEAMSADTGKPTGLVDEDQDLMDLLQSEGDFSDIGDMLKAEESHADFSNGGQDEFMDFSIGEEDAMEGVPVEEESKGKKRKKKAKKQKMEKEEHAGFLQRISQALFGEDEGEEKTAEPVKAAAVAATATPGIDELSDENLMILQELEGAQPVEEPVAAEPEEDPKEKKKREKKEKKEKAKKEKKEKQEQAKKARADKKAKKVKKPKPPKEPDNTPPLPRKPVILTFVMVASFLALVLLGTNYFGYSSSMEKAERSFGLGDYEAAFAEVSGMEMKEKDWDTYEKYRIMAYAAGEYSAYQSFMDTNMYDMALDSLIRTIGRCDKYQADAETYGCPQELARLREQAAGALSSFGVTEERALALYAAEDRDTYSTEIYAVLAEAGFSID